MDEEMRAGITQVLADFENDDLRVRTLVGDAEDILEATKTGIGYMIEELNELAGTFLPDRKYQKGEMATASIRLERAWNNLGPLLQIPGKLSWPSPISQHPCDDQSERLFLEEHKRLEKTIPLEEKKAFVERELIEPAETQLRHRTAWLKGLIVLLREYIETGEIRDKPTWRKDTCKLWFRKKTVREVDNVLKATNIVAILDEFEEEGWPDAIASPIQVGKLKDSVKSLNDDLKLIRFHVSSGQVTWEILPTPS